MGHDLRLDHTHLPPVSQPALLKNESGRPLDPTDQPQVEQADHDGPHPGDLAERFKLEQKRSRLLDKEMFLRLGEHLLTNVVKPIEMNLPFLLL